MITYQLQKNPFGEVTSVWRSDGWAIPLAPDNTDYQAYLKWVAEGNTPLQPDEGTQ